MELAARFVGENADVVSDPRFRVVLFGSIISPMGVALVSPLLRVYGVSEARIGLVMAAFTAPAIVAIPLVGMVSDRYGRKPVLTAGLALFGAALRGSLVSVGESTGRIGSTVAPIIMGGIVAFATPRYGFGPGVRPDDV